MENKTPLTTPEAVDVVSTLSAIACDQAIGLNAHPRTLDRLRIHLEALVAAVRDEERAKAKTTKEALAEVLEMHRIETEKLRESLKATANDLDYIRCMGPTQAERERSRIVVEKARDVLYGVEHD